MKKVILASVMLFATVMVYGQFSGGEGTKAHPYQIKTAADESKFADYVLHHGDTATQINWTNGKYFQVPTPEAAARLERGDKNIRNTRTVGERFLMEQERARYATGELIPQWVKNRWYTIMQVGTKRFPDGLLLKEIYSWIDGKSVSDTTYTFQGTIIIKPFPGTPAQPAKIDTTTTTTTTVTVIPGKPDTTVVTTTEPIATDTTKVGDTNVVQAPDSTDGKFRGFHRIGLGARGGFSSHLQDAEKDFGKWKVGWMAAFDFEYAYYFSKKHIQKPWLGIKTGVSLVFARNPLQSDATRLYATSDPEGTEMQYEVYADDVKEHDGQLQLEIPLMFSLLHKGLFFNIGPKFMIPLYAPYRQKIDNATIIARYPQYGGYPITDEVITGVATPDVMDTKGTWDRSKFDIMIGAEIGYEWELKRGALGLGVFADYSVFNTFKNDPAKENLLRVSVPDVETPAVVSAVSATDNFASRIGYFDVGVKLIYNFNIYKKLKSSK